LAKVIKSFKEIIDNWQIFDDNSHIYGLFFYKYYEKNVAYNVRYIVRQHYYHYESSNIFYFLMERPIDKQIEIKSWKEKLGFSKDVDYWEDYEAFLFETVFDKFPDDDIVRTDLIKVIPYGDAIVNQIAGLFKIPSEYIPCIVYFRNMKESDILLYPLNNSWEDLDFKDVDIIITHLVCGREKDTIWENLLTFCKKDSPIHRWKKPYYIKLQSSVGDIFKQIHTIVE
jgi:hypothetical protein